MNPEYNTLVKVDSQFINSFIKGKSALSDVETFAVKPSKNGVEFVIGYSDMNSNRISINVQSGAVDLTDSISFNANLFSQSVECEQRMFKGRTTN